MSACALAMTGKERRELMRLLGILQTQLECAIETALVPGTNRPMPEDAAGVAQDRRDWKAAEGWVKRLEELGRA